MLNAYTSNDGGFSDVVQARIATLKCAYRIVAIRHRALQRLARIEICDDTSEEVSSNESNRI